MALPSIATGSCRGAATTAVITHAWTAQQHLQQRYNHLSYRKRPRITVVAAARELVGFLWAVMGALEPAGVA